jgi:uncharacterized Fe-S cluster-containing radical SAM superfamily protein
MIASSASAAPRVLPEPNEPLPGGKFQDRERTADGERRASVRLRALSTLWFNTGTLCNLSCAHCYIESTPTNDRLVYLSAAEVNDYLAQIEELSLATEEIGFTGGEPFMNPEIVPMLEAALDRGHRVLVLSNGMRPMMRHAPALLRLRERFGKRLEIRVSLDHYRPAEHETLRGAESWQPALDGVRWLAEHRFALRVAGRSCWGESEDELREGFARLFAERDIDIDSADPAELVLFPEMDERLDVSEITVDCWGILDVDPGSVMCASSRMVVKRRGAARPAVVACTLLPYEPEFELGGSLADASGDVWLNHPHCARFCVLGGGSCSTR